MGLTGSMGAVFSGDGWGRPFRRPLSGYRVSRGPGRRRAAPMQGSPALGVGWPGTEPAPKLGHASAGSTPLTSPYKPARRAIRPALGNPKGRAPRPRPDALEPASRTGLTLG